MYFAPARAKFLTRPAWSGISQRSGISLDTGMNVDIGTSEQHMLTKAILKKKIAWQGE
jgi:hypothetical protein